MGKILVHEFISLDGVIEKPVWTFQFPFDERTGADIGGIIGSSEVLLLGRQTYVEFAPAWSSRTPEQDPGAPFFNESPKYVVSGTMRESIWNNTTFVGAYDARSGGASIACQVIGDGPIDLLLVPWFVSHVEASWEEPNLAWFLSRLASFTRLIIFDQRGTGLSDPVTRIPTIEQRIDEVRAVLDAVGSETATIFGASEGGTMSVLFARAHPERARALILYGSWARRIACQGYPWGMQQAELHELLDHMSSAWATPARGGLDRRSRWTTSVIAAGGRGTSACRRARRWHAT